MTSLSSKIFYNGIIRYVQTSTLKLSIMQASILVIAYSDENYVSSSIPAMAKQYAAYLILTAIVLWYFKLLSQIGQQNDLKE